MHLKPFPASQHEADVAARVVFFVDAGIKIFGLVLALLTPGFVLKWLVPASKRRHIVTEVGDYKVSEEIAVRERVGITPLATSITRWFGAALAIAAYVELRSLISFENVALGYTLEGLALGDLLHVIVALQLRSSVGGWSFGNVLSILWVLFALGWRIYYLVMHYRYDVKGTMHKWYPDYNP